MLFLTLSSKTLKSCNCFILAGREFQSLIHEYKNVFTVWLFTLGIKKLWKPTLVQFLSSQHCYSIRTECPKNMKVHKMKLLHGADVKCLTASKAYMYTIV